MYPRASLGREWWASISRYLANQGAGVPDINRSSRLMRTQDVYPGSNPTLQNPAEIVDAIPRNAVPSKRVLPRRRKLAV